MAGGKQTWQPLLGTSRCRDHPPLCKNASYNPLSSAPFTSESTREELDEHQESAESQTMRSHMYSVFICLFIWEAELQRESRKEKKSSIFWFIFPNGCHSQDWVRPKPGDWNSIKDSRVNETAKHLGRLLLSSQRAGSWWSQGIPASPAL